jgi:PIN domain nuclease of toxin-antitoxin system
MNGLMADTHALVWYLFQPARLSSNAMAAMRNAVQAGSIIYASVMSIIEVRYLVEKGRLPEVYYEDLVIAAHDPNLPLQFVPIDQDVALATERISRDVVPDMPDRIIAATALTHNLSLVTADHKISASKNITTIW